MRKTLNRRKINRDTPPKIVYLIGFLAYAAWGGWAYLLLYRPPDEPVNRLFFVLSSTSLERLPLERRRK